MANPEHPLGLVSLRLQYSAPAKGDSSTGSVTCRVFEARDLPAQGSAKTAHPYAKVDPGGAITL